MINPIIGSAGYRTLEDKINDRLGALSNYSFGLNRGEKCIIHHPADNYTSLLCMQTWSGSGHYSCLLTGYNVGAIRNYIIPLTDNQSFTENIIFSIDENDTIYTITHNYDGYGYLTCSLTCLNGDPCTVEIV